MTVGPAPRRLTWGDIDTCISRIVHGCEEVGTPQTIVAVVRGGMVPAVMVAHRLAVRDVRVVDVTHTVDDVADAAKTVRPVTRNIASLGDLSGLDVLVIDDVAGSGDTLGTVVRLVEQAGALRVRAAVLVVNEANWTRSRPPHEAVTRVGEISRGWVVFPWEAGAPRSGRIGGVPMSAGARFATPV